MAVSQAGAAECGRRVMLCTCVYPCVKRHQHRTAPQLIALASTTIRSASSCTMSFTHTVKMAAQGVGEHALHSHAASQSRSIAAARADGKANGCTSGVTSSSLSQPPALQRQQQDSWSLPPPNQAEHHHQIRSSSSSSGGSSSGSSTMQYANACARTPDVPPPNAGSFSV